ncbi:acyl-CoA dehydrogenase family protein [Metapseudomonas furukawaii]
MPSEARQLHQNAESLLDVRLFPVDFGNLTAKVERLARKLAENAVARDRQGGHARAERELIRESGLLALAIPQRFDGLEKPWPQIYRIVRHLAAADSSLAHLFAFNHLQVATILLHGSTEQQRHWLSRAAHERWFWGNATNGRDLGLQLQKREEHFELNGRKSFCSGALGADALVVSAPRGGSTSERAFLVLPTQREGLAINDDWDAFGQRQTDSGTVQFENVFVDRGELLVSGGQSPRSSLRVCVSQLILTQLYLGNSQAALDGALRYVREQARPWLGAGVNEASEDPFIQKRFGELWLLYRGALLQAELAAERLQQAWDKPALSAAERGEVALLIAEARVASARASLEITSQVFETMGARATASSYGFDRFWRNVRVHSLHDPLDYKVRDIGQWLTRSVPPTPSLYS